MLNIDETTKRWGYFHHLLSVPANDQEYDEKVEALDSLLDVVGADEDHPLASLVGRLGDVIEAYDETHYPMPDVSGSDVLRFMMEEHGIKQSELPEIGTQSVVSEVLSGKRNLNWRQIQALSHRFNVSTDMFRDS